jgi:hypothetical protein
LLGGLTKRRLDVGARRLRRLQVFVRGAAGRGDEGSEGNETAQAHMT